MYDWMKHKEQRVPLAQWMRENRLAVEDMCTAFKAGKFLRLAMGSDEDLEGTEAVQVNGCWYAWVIVKG